jgi:hypothetical protein
LRDLHGAFVDIIEGVWVPAEARHGVEKITGIVKREQKDQ